MTSQIWTSQDRKFATNSVCRKDAISFVKVVNQCSEENATHYVDSLVLECQQEAIKMGKVSHKVFLVRDDINEVDVYIDTCYYMVEN